MQPYDYPLNNDTLLRFETSDKVFYPTGTTKLLIDSVKKGMNKPGSVLDIGCGTGVVGTVLHKLGLATTPLYASDLSAEAIKLTAKNCQLHGVDVVAKSGALFEPWRGMVFDYIVDDVSGIAEAIGNVSDWFKGASCQSGKDGTDLVIKIIQDATDYLEESGKLFFPVLSLSNQIKIIDEANKCFKNVESLGQMEWPLPSDLLPHVTMLRQMREDGDIDFKEKFGMIIWTTEIFVASN